MVIATNEMEFWLNGHEITHVTGRSLAPNACHGNDLNGEWRAPSGFDSLYIGLERYADSTNEQNLWVDDVVLSDERVGCPTNKHR